MGIIEFNGISSKDLGVEVETFPDYVSPEKEYQVTHVPGRNGDLVVDTKTFQNVPRSYEVSVATNGVPIDVVNAAVARFKSSSRMPIKSLKSEIVAVESGSGEKSPTNPYTISGFDSGVITRCGKNLLGGLALGNAIVNAVNNPNASKFDSDVNGNFVTIDAGGATNNKNFTNGIRFKENTCYTLILRLTRYQTGTTLNSNIAFHYTDGTQNTVYFSATTASEVVTIAKASLEGKTLQYISTSFGGGITRLFYESSGIFEGVLTVGDYEAYNGNIYTFAFGQTVYGGHFDNKGNLVVTHRYILVNGSETFTMVTSGAFRYFNMAMANPLNANAWETDIISNIFKKQGQGCPYCQINSTKRICFVFSINNTSVTSVADLQALLTNTNAQIVYPLATPITLAITSQDIPTLLGENNIFSNCGDVSVKVEPSFPLIINQVAEWLHSASGYARLEDTYDPDHYRMAYYSESLSVENLFNEAGKATLNFICKPQRYLKSGETSIVFTGEGTIQNGTRFSSSPVLKVTTNNTQGSVSIGNHTITIKAGAGTDPITIDCELQDAWSGTTNKNSFIVLTDGEFPVIDPGTQTVTFDGGVQSVEVIPRWWTV